MNKSILRYNTIFHSKGNVWPLLYFILASFAFLSVFSISTSPLYTNPFLDDSGVFMLIGKGWTKGMIPYIDLWDNKGPLLYLINAIGFWLRNDVYGVFILQVINTSISLFVIYRLFRTHYNCKTSVFWTTIALLWFSNTGMNNNAAEWILIPQCVSFYLLYQWLKDDPREKLSWKSSALFGFTIGCGFLLRFSDCLPLIFSLFVIACFLIADKRWKEVCKHILICVVSAAFTILPFIIYYYIIGGLEEMWYATFAHNFEYVMGSSIQSYSIYAIGSYIVSFAVYIGAIFTGLLVILYRKPSRRTAWVWLIASVGTLLFIFQTFARGTYGVSSLPLLCFVIFQADELLEESSVLITRICLSSLLFFVLATFAYQGWQSLNRDGRPNPYLGFYKHIERVIPTEERKSFMAFNMTPDIYVYTHLRPVHRFFVTYSGCLRDKNDSLIEKIRDEYQKKRAKWILVEDSPHGIIIQDLLNRDYVVHESYPQLGLRLYKMINED